MVIRLIYINNHYGLALSCDNNSYVSHIHWYSLTFVTFYKEVTLMLAWDCSADATPQARLVRAAALRPPHQSPVQDAYINFNILCITFFVVHKLLYINFLFKVGCLGSVGDYLYLKCVGGGFSAGGTVWGTLGNLKEAWAACLRETGWWWDVMRHDWDYHVWRMAVGAPSRVLCLHHLAPDGFRLPLVFPQVKGKRECWFDSLYQTKWMSKCHKYIFVRDLSKDR